MNYIILIAAVLYAVITSCIFFILLRRRHLAVLRLQDDAAAHKRRHLQYELITALTLNVGVQDDTNILIRNSLMMVVMAMKVSRASIARVNQENNTLSFEYEWKNTNLQIKPLSQINMSFSKGNLFYDTFIGRGDVSLICSNMGKNHEVTKALELPGIKSCIFVPITMNGQFWGLMGIEHYKDGTAWKDGDAQIMILAAGAIVSLLIKSDAEKALITAKEQAELTSEAKTTFLSRMSHEMRTPMNAILGMTTIARNSRDNTRVEYCLTKINEASQHLLGIINDVLDMSKIESGKFSLSIMEFDFERMLKRVTDMIEFRINEKRQRLILHLDPKFPSRVIADEQRLVQVLTNLLSNAVKFTPEEGIITLSVRVMRRDKLCTIRFNVIDTGIGINEEQKSRLFTPFEQADGSISRRFGGTGLGLVISKNITEIMGGRIWFESETGKGSNFYVELSLEEGKPINEKPQKHWRKNIRILAAEDTTELLDYYKEYAKQVEIHCTTARSGIEAIKIIEKEPAFDIIFADWRLPLMNGVELCERIRSRNGSEKVILMITPSEWDIVEAEAKKSGIDTFIPKPVFPSMITEIISRYLPENPSIEIKPENTKTGNIFYGYTILVAEDIEINREILLSLLEDTGIVIECANDGKAAINMFSANPEKYDLVLTDIHMPEIDGYEATRRIRNMGIKGNEIPILAMTANVFKEDIERCLAAGMNDHIGKPLEIHDLLDKLQKYLPAIKRKNFKL